MNSYIEGFKNRRKRINKNESISSMNLIEKLIYKYLQKRGGSIKLKSGIVIVAQTEDFHDYCYNEVYKNWRERKRNSK